jgi:hypothetical protein
MDAYRSRRRVLSRFIRTLMTHMQCRAWKKLNPPANFRTGVEAHDLALDR